MPVCSKDSEIRIGACGLGVGSEPSPAPTTPHGRWAELLHSYVFATKALKIHTSLNGLTSCKFWFLCIFLQSAYATP